MDENAILDLIEGRLASGDRAAADEHVRGCDDCRSLLEEAFAGGSPSEGDGPVSLAPAPGLRVAGRYVLSHPIGIGGMGVVWAADQDGGQRVALKFLKSAGVDRARRFLREAKIAASLRHPNIVQVHEILGAEGDAPPVIVMELLTGESLATHLRRSGALPLGRAASLLLPVVDAVSAAHVAGIVHRDLKPENVFVAAGPPEQVKVLDFGIAKRTRHHELAGSTPDLTRTGAVMGTPFYMAPEQMFGEKTIDGRADVWALGVVLYECLAGRRPIAGDNFGQVLKNATMGSIAPLRSVAPWVPAEVGELAAKMLSRAPAERPSLREVAEVLERHREDDTLPSTQVELPYAATVAETRTIASDHGATPSAVARSVAPPRPGSRQRLGRAAIGGAMLLAASFAAWGLSRSQAATPSSAGLASAAAPPAAPGGEALAAVPRGESDLPPPAPASSMERDGISPSMERDGIGPSMERDGTSPSTAEPRRPAAPAAQPSAKPRASASAPPSPKESPARNKLAGGVEKDPPY